MSDNEASLNRSTKDFLAEAEEIADRLGSGLADLADMADSGDLNPDLLNSIFRGAHSLKGLAGMFGFSDISGLSHNMENLLDWLRLGKLNLDQRSISVLFRSHALLTTLIRSVSEGEIASHSSEIADCVARINDCLTLPEKPDGSLLLEQLGLPGQFAGALTEYEEHRLLDNLKKDKAIYLIHTSFELTVFDRELARITELLKTRGEVISTFPVVGVNLDTHIDFDILFGTGARMETLGQLFENDDVSIVQLDGATSIQPGPLPAAEKSALKQTELSSLVTIDDVLSSKSMSRTVRVDIGKLDELMNIVGELVLAHSSISAIANRMRNEGFSRTAVDLDKAAKGLERKLTDLRKGVMEIRMIPVGQLYEKMSRIVRKISREQGKKIELKFYGADTELDKLIVEDISDPMMHIVRNAVDHGIESPEERLAAHKDEKGIIRISSRQKGNHVVIEVEDDGAGIDVERIKSRALHKGLIRDASNLSDREALDLIFTPGFSTVDRVSEVSGRGVGLDVVKNNIASVSGMVDIETRKGEGSRFIITLPITLAIIKALIIECSGRIYAIPVTSVLESLLLTDDDIKTVKRKEFIQLREATLPLFRLESFFRINHTVERSAEYYAVVVGTAEKRLGIVVDNLLGQQDIVIKSIGETFKRFPGISGAADLGNQRTILVLDVEGLTASRKKTETVESCSGKAPSPPPPGINDDTVTDASAVPAVSIEEFLCIRISNETYGINIMRIKEIIKPREVTEVPLAPSFLSGIISLRGVIIPVLDTSKRLGLARKEVTGKERLVVVKHGESFSGLLVDEVIQVVRIGMDEIESAPAVTDGINRDFIDGIRRTENQMIILLNLETITDINLD